MSFQCDFPGCEKESVYWLEYPHKRPRCGGWCNPDYVGYRCKNHIISTEGMIHPIAGLPEVIYKFDGNGKPQLNLVKRIARLFEKEKKEKIKLR